MGVRRWLTVAATALAVVLGLSSLAVGGAQAGPRKPTAGDRITIQFVSDQQDTYSYFWVDGNNRMAAGSNPVRPGMKLHDHNRRTRVWSRTVGFTSQRKDQQIGAGITSWGGYAGCSIWVNGVRVRHHVYRAPIFAQAVCGMDTIDTGRVDFHI
ncbi:hypothetical protein [Gordonia aurantiaca]|uniref:hypothetical protein n=1 Tax=Gordonia sp. B21 TaxID=3151852 RepID=UPI003263EA4F